jgi:hypothetical protein
LDPLKSLSDEELGGMVAQGDKLALAELTRRHSAPTPAPAQTTTDAAPKVPDGMEIVRDVHTCVCGHPASDVKLDLNAHSLDHPFRCHVDNCRNCPNGFEYAGPFYRQSGTAPTAAAPTGRFASTN